MFRQDSKDIVLLSKEAFPTKPVLTNSLVTDSLESASGKLKNKTMKSPLSMAPKKKAFLPGRVNHKKEFAKSMPASQSGEPRLSDQEVADVLEAFRVGAHLTALMDDGDLDAALKEARALVSHTNAQVRLMACGALDWIGGDAIYDLAELINDPVKEIAAAAGDSFWEQVEELPDDMAKLNLLGRLLDSMDGEMQVQLAEALSEFHPYVAFDPLLTLYNSSQGSTREDVVWELEILTGESFESADEWQNWFNSNKIALEEDYQSSIRK